MNIRTRLAQAVVISSLASSALGAQLPAGPWEIGPVIQGRNYSVGLPPTPDHEAGQLSFPIGPTAEPHYVTAWHGSLRGKTQIRMRFRVDGPVEAIIHGAKCPSGSPAAVTLYFQREGDNWRADGGRWWATFASRPLTGPAGEMEIVGPLDANWTSVSSMTASNSPNQFAAAKDSAGRVGFTFGNCEGLGHGARATLPVRFVLTHFEVI